MLAAIGNVAVGEWILNHKVQKKDVINHGYMWQNVVIVIRRLSKQV